MSDIEFLIPEQETPTIAPVITKRFTDTTATWEYWTSLDSAAAGVPDEWIWERLRNRRDSLIAECDWRLVADAKWDTAPWITYRQALRDLPEKTKDPRKAKWPTEPGNSTP